MPKAENEFVFETFYGVIAIAAENVSSAERKVKNLCDELDEKRQDIDAIMEQYGARFSVSEYTFDQTSAKDSH
jgi:hypothetical protein